MSDRRLAAAFFILKEQEELPLETLENLLCKAQATNIFTEPSTASQPWNTVYCKWAGLTHCTGYIHELSYHWLLYITFSHSQFLRLLPPEVDEIHPLEDCFVPLEADPTLPIAVTFKHACEALKPEVALIATHVYDGELNWILDREWMVLAKDATALADQHFGLLYLNEDISHNWLHHPLRDDRDSLPVASGQIVFAGRGCWRWF